MLTLTIPSVRAVPHLGRDVAATVERLSDRYGPWCRPSNLTVGVLLSWLADRGEYVPVAVVKAVGEAWRAERG